MSMNEGEPCYRISVRNAGLSWSKLFPRGPKVVGERSQSHLRPKLGPLEGLEPVPDFRNQQVAGSIPAGGSSSFNDFRLG
jgi:hypothetical protein